MCLVLPSRVLAVVDRQADIELPDGQRASVDLSLAPEAAVGDYVLVDRGMALKVIDAGEAQAILQIYAEYGDLMAGSDDGLPDWATESARG